jgi:antitoxin component of MazEF toxin-antitoxin module
MMRENDLIQAFIGNRSLTLLLPKRIAEELGLQNGEFLKCYVEDNRLIVERKYRSASTLRTKALEEDC